MHADFFDGLVPVYLKNPPQPPLVRLVAVYVSDNISVALVAQPGWRTSEQFDGSDERSDLSGVN